MVMQVYKLTNKIDGKVYIGKSSNPHQRLIRHLSIAKTGGNKKHDYQYLHRAINKHGKENFVFEIIEICSSDQEAFQREKYWIEYYQSNILDKGYNLNEGGLGGGSPSNETKEKISRSLSGRINSLPGLLNRLFRLFCLIPGYKQNHYKSANEINLDKKRSEILSANNLPIVVNNLPDDIKRQILALWNTNIFNKSHLAAAFGVKYSTINYVISRYKDGIPTEDEKRLNRSNGHKGKKHSEEHKRKISESNKGKITSEKTKEKISQANSGENNGMANRTHSKESRAKMSSHQSSRQRRPLTEQEKIKLSSVLKGRPRPAPIPEELKCAVREMYASGSYTKNQIANQLNLKYNAVVKILRK